MAVGIKAPIRAQVEHLICVIKGQFGFHKTRLRSGLKNSRKINLLAALANLFMARHVLVSNM
jgi:IS5 family transposase